MKTTKLEKGNWYLLDNVAHEYVGVYMGEHGFTGHEGDRIHLVNESRLASRVGREATNDEVAEVLASREAYYIGKGAYLDRIGYTPKA